MTTVPTSAERRPSSETLMMLRIQKDDYQLLSQGQQIVLVRLHTGHTERSNAPQAEVGILTTLTHDQEYQTIEFLLQRCSLHRLQ